MSVSDYKQLRVYQLAFQSAVEIFELSKKFPGEEKFSLTDQLRRASRSVCANIAEAWRKRRYEAAFVSKLSDADTEAAETEVWLSFAFRHGYLNAATHGDYADRYDHICRQLRRMMEEAPRWCASDDRVREEQAEYFVERAENAERKADSGERGAGSVEREAEDEP
jgi:four helix bundle protein